MGELLPQYDYGFLDGVDSITKDPMTSVVKWVRYDGTKETLPQMERVCLVNIAGNETYLASLDKDGDWRDQCFDVRHPVFRALPGDLWAYLPTPPEQEESACKS